jgi:hypothetical protein
MSEINFLSLILFSGMNKTSKIEERKMTTKKTAVQL